MRIAYVCTDPGIEVFGTKGASVHAREMLAAFLARGAKVTLISPRIGRPPVEFAALRLAPLPAIPGGAPAARAAAQLALNEAVTATLRAAGPFDLVYERHALYAHGAMEEAARQGIPGVLEVNAPLIEESGRHRVLARPEAAAESTRRAMRAGRLVSVVSAGVADYARAYGAERVAVIPNAVDPARFPAVHRPEGRLVIGFLGTLRPWHDVATLVAAMPLLRRRHPRARLLVVGDGPERERLAPELAALRAELAGVVEPAAVPRWLAQMDIAVAPYRGNEPFYFSPLKVYEYMAAGLPVVASDVGDLGSLVLHGRTGLVCRPDDAAALAAALGQLADDPTAARRMGEAGRRQVEQYTWGGVAARVIELAAAPAEAA